MTAAPRFAAALVLAPFGGPTVAGAPAFVGGPVVVGGAAVVGGPVVVGGAAFVGDPVAARAPAGGARPDARSSA